MKDRFRTLFVRSNNFIRWIESPGWMGMQKTGNIFVFMLLIIGSLLAWIGDTNKVMSNILVGTLMITI